MTDTPESKRKTLYLIDGPNLAFRAFFAIGGMASSNGQPTNALFGFTNMLLKLIREHRPDYLAITWDPRDGSFRDQEYPDYKGTRPDMPDALGAQMPHFSRIADAFDVPFLVLDGFESWVRWRDATPTSSTWCWSARTRT
jgi:DNA polymerase-1